MTTRDAVEGYLAVVRTQGNWEDYLADDVVFTSLVSPNRLIEGKPGVEQMLKRFYAMVDEFSVRSIVAEGDRAMVLSHYRIKPPAGVQGFESDVAEAYVVRDGKIVDFKICFDSAPYPKQSSQ